MRNLHLSVVLLTSSLMLSCGGGSSTPDGGGGGQCTMFGPVCLFPPQAAAERTQCGDVTDYCDKSGNKTPALSCIGQTPSEPATPATVTLTGFVHVFSSGPNSDNLNVSVFDAAPLLAGGDLATATPIATGKFALDPTTQRACDTEKANGCGIPSLTGCMVPLCNDGVNGRSDDKKYCREVTTGNFECSGRLRWEARYSLPNIPTNKQLAIKVTGPNGTSDQVWATTVQFNVYASTASRACTGLGDVDCLDKTDPNNVKFQLNTNALSAADYINIPTTSGLASGISPGFGAVAGEIHDCDNVRVGNVAVALSPPGDRFTYFNGNPVKTLPDSSRIAYGTDQLGLFAAFNIRPGKVTVQAAGSAEAGGTLADYGSFEAIVYADTVSVINVNGGHPQ